MADISLQILPRVTNMKSETEYLSWHKKKYDIDRKQTVPPFNQREIWWCSLGLNIGREEDGKNSDFERPVLILRKFSPDVFVGLPLTSMFKKSPYYFPYSVLENTPGAIVLSQPRLLSSKRLNRKLSRMGRGLFREVKSAYLTLYQ